MDFDANFVLRMAQQTFAVVASIRSDLTSSDTFAVIAKSAVGSAFGESSVSQRPDDDKRIFIMNCHWKKVSWPDSRGSIVNDLT